MFDYEKDCMHGPASSEIPHRHWRRKADIGSLLIKILVHFTGLVVEKRFCEMNVGHDMYE